MKKIFSLLTSFTILFTTTSLVVACGGSGNSTLKEIFTSKNANTFYWFHENNVSKNIFFIVDEIAGTNESNGAIYLISKKDDYKNQAISFPSLNKNTVYPWRITSDGLGNNWIGTYQHGLYELAANSRDPKQINNQKMPLKNPMQGSNIWISYLNNDMAQKRVYFGSHYYKLTYYDYQTKTFENIDKPGTAVTDGVHVNAMSSAPDGTIIVASEHASIARVTFKSDKTVDSINTIKSTNGVGIGDSDGLYYDFKWNKQSDAYFITSEDYNPHLLYVPRNNNSKAEFTEMYPKTPQQVADETPHDIQLIENSQNQDVVYLANNPAVNPISGQISFGSTFYQITRTTGRTFIDKQITGLPQLCAIDSQKMITYNNQKYDIITTLNKGVYYLKIGETKVNRIDGIPNNTESHSVLWKKETKNKIILNQSKKLVYVNNGGAIYSINLKTMKGESLNKTLNKNAFAKQMLLINDKTLLIGGEDKKS